MTKRSVLLIAPVAYVPSSCNAHFYCCSDTLYHVALRRAAPHY